MAMIVVHKRRLFTVGLTLVLAVAVLVIAVAREEGALRYLLTWDPAPAGSAPAGAETGPESSGEMPSGTATSGEDPAATPVPEPDFFADFRLDRERARGEQLEYLREMVNNTQFTEDMRKEAGEQWLAITRQVGKELELEGLIKAKGFEDCIVFLQESSCTVVVKVDRLSRTQVAQIGDIVVRGTGLSAKDVNIVSRPQ